MKANELTPSRYLILIFLCVLALLFSGCTSSMKQTAVTPQIQQPKHSNVTYSYFNYADNTKAKNYEDADLTFLRDYDAWQQEVYGPLIALGPFLVDNPK
jgi:uncharacterized protein YceK